MKLKSLLACLFIVAAFPLLASQSGNSSVNSVPFASVAFAGHSLPGNYYCECGGEDCICDQGENPHRNSKSINTPPKEAGSFSAQGAAISSGLDIGTSAMMLTLAFFAWARFLRT